MGGAVGGMEGFLEKESLLCSLVAVGMTMTLAGVISQRLTARRVHASAIAIACGLVAAMLAGWATGGTRGVADLAGLGGVAILGGATLRDLAIVATAFSAKLDELVQAGLRGVLSLVLGVCGAFACGAIVAYGFGYRDPVDLATIGGGAATYIVGPVTGTALGATSDVVALAVATGLVKSILVMLLTPTVAPLIGLNRPAAAMVFGGLMGTTSGVVAGLAATDPRLVPYGAVTSTFYTGLGCLLGPSLFVGVLRAIL
jgi:malonate transporter MadM subunit